MGGVGGRDTEVEGYSSREFGCVSFDEGNSFQGSKGAKEEVGVEAGFCSVQIYHSCWRHYGLVFPGGVHGVQDVFFKDFGGVEICSCWGSS